MARWEEKSKAGRKELMKKMGRKGKKEKGGKTISNKAKGSVGRESQNDERKRNRLGGNRTWSARRRKI